MTNLVDVHGNELTLKKSSFAPRTPPAVSAAMATQGMNQTANLGPGSPITPMTGYSVRPKASDYPVGVNIAMASRQAWGRTDYSVLKGLIDAWDVARMCINHKIDEIRSMEPLFTPADGISGDVADAIDAAKAVMAFPDREHDWNGWINILLENALRYDSAPTYRRRNMDGDIIAYENVDGTTVFPYVDDHGRRPAAPAPAYFQRRMGMTDTWFTSQDMSYNVFRPQADSPYGLAPIESILLTANTDLKFQWHFLQMFTDGSIPGGFMQLPPDVSSPDQVAEWQEYWDAVTLGDQSILHHLVAVPNGSTVTETRPKAFDKTFPQYLMSRAAAAYGVVPQDIGVIEDVNMANGETQMDIQFRVNTLPWVRFVEGIVNRYLQLDLGLPVKMNLDTGRDKEDRLADAQAWAIGVQNAAVSADEMRQELYGFAIDNERPVPRGFVSSKSGFIPLVSIESISGKVDPETAAPAEDVVLDPTQFGGSPGIIPEKQPGAMNFDRAPLNPDEPNMPAQEQIVPGTSVVAAPLAKSEATAGVTSASGISGVDVADQDDTDELLKSELGQFRRFRSARERRGQWRDFQFKVVPPIEAHRLNTEARGILRKAAGEIVAAGLAVLAQDTGRVLMLQRALDITDPASGAWEFPGGHVEDVEDVYEAACREWQEEVGAVLPYGFVGGQWLSPNGVYAGFVFVVAEEALVPTRTGSGFVENPDDPDGDEVESIAWWAPTALVGNPVIRAELAADASLVLGAITEAAAAIDPALTIDGPTEQEIESLDTDVNRLAVVADAATEYAVELKSEMDADPAVEANVNAPMEDDAGPLAKGWRDTAPKTPQLRYDLPIADHYTGAVQDGIRQLIGSLPVQSTIEHFATTMAKKTAEEDELLASILGRLGATDTTQQLEQAIRDILTDGYMAGLYAGGEQIGAHSVTVGGVTGNAVTTIDWSKWSPGDGLAAAKDADGGLAALLDDAGITVKGITESTLNSIGNAIADGLKTGRPSDSIARDITEDVGSSDRAERIAHTETARAVTQASMDVYGANGVATWDLITSDGACQTCLDIEEQNPHPVSDSGGTPPVHPFCRCSSAPNANSVVASNITVVGESGSLEPTTD
jgi:8-oxo-dGTP pyrophosphatase MutT (NUDIX family)